MEKDWVTVFTTGENFEAELVKGMLMDNGINAVVLNGRDSEFGTFGEAAVYVHVSQAPAAQKLIQAK
ncbi:MAG TPA: DUF2007 domain-containing protein [Chitinophagaceae bacterium]|nr:DUF2007 domain-containing protein [Chitinophagaceae bacterium]